MYITSDEAQEKQCPYCFNNPTIENYVEATCVGKHCMAWRYSTRGATQGFCGLAGKPLD
jgi:hypothetical protein